MGRKKSSLMESKLFWKSLRIIFWLGILFWSLLIFFDVHVGTESFTLSVVELFWLVGVPFFVFIIYFSPNFWRNVCPLSSTNLFYFNFFHKKRLNKKGRKANLLMVGKKRKLKVWVFLRNNGVIVSALLFWFLIPLRLMVFYYSGFWTLVLLGGLFGSALLMGFLFPVKSGWCTSICPVFSVEKAYSINVGRNVRNTRCDFVDNTKGGVVQNCSNCSVNCMDQTNPEDVYWKEESLNVFHDMGNAWIRKVFISTFPGLIFSYFMLIPFLGFFPTNPVFRVMFTYGVFALFMVLSSGLYFFVKHVLKQKVLKKEKVIEKEHPSVRYSRYKNRLNLVYINLAFNLFFFFSLFAISFMVLPAFFNLNGFVFNFFGSPLFISIFGIVLLILSEIFILFITYKNISQGWKETWINNRFKPNWF